MAYQNYLFSNRANDTHIKIYAFSLDNATAKAAQYGTAADKMFYSRQVGGVPTTEPVEEIYSRSFFEALLLHKGLYGKFIEEFGDDYMAEDKAKCDTGWAFEDGIAYRQTGLFKDNYADGNNHSFLGKLGSFNRELVALLESVGYEIADDGRDEGDAFFAMQRNDVLPFNLPDWCSFIF